MDIPDIEAPIILKETCHRESNTKSLSKRKLLSISEKHITLIVKHRFIASKQQKKTLVSKSFALVYLKGTKVSLNYHKKINENVDNQRHNLLSQNLGSNTIALIRCQTNNFTQSSPPADHW